MNPPGWRQRWRYRFDTFMARGGISIFTSLTAVFLGIFFLLAVTRLIIFLLFPDLPIHHEKRGFWGHVYITFLEMTDPGNMAQDIDSSGWYKIFAVMAGMAGVIMLSALIAFITTALDQKLSELKRGHSKIIEENHTLILGWNPQRVVEIVRELIIANESEDDACVVILADVEKEEMDDHLRLQFPDSKSTRIVTRRGNTASMVALDVVSAETSKSVIILGECGDSASPAHKIASDAKVIQTVLALTSMVSDKVDRCIVVEIFNKTYRDVLTSSFSSNVVAVDTSDILAKILVQTSRSVGLSVVYNEILSFDGCEMYFYETDWRGAKFGEIGYRFPDGAPMGVRQPDGHLLIKPDADYAMQDGDSILILADDNSTIDYRPTQVAAPRDLPLAGGRQEKIIERELIIGWTHKAPVILHEYADYVQPGSRIDIMLHNPGEATRREIEAINAEIPDVEITLIEKNCLSSSDLMSVEPFKYNNIIILADASDELSEQQVDSENIVTLLLLREIFRQHPAESANTKLITEVLDSQNYTLVAKAGVKDVIISNRLVSMMLAQVSESREIKFVYDDLFEEEGSEIYLKPLSLYAAQFPFEATFADLMALAQKREEICLGVKIKSLEEDEGKNYGVKLIPPKTESFSLRPEDSLIVLAEDES